MIEQVNELLNEYWTWLKDNTSTRDLGGPVEITTLYLDRHNDQLQIYVRRDDSGYTLTDDAYVIGDLELSGCDISSKRRRDLLQTTLNGFGVQRDGDALSVHATKANFAAKKHNLVQAMVAVNDMFFTAQATVESLFLEDVAAWLDQIDVRYTPKVKFTGRSGYDHVFHFVIPKSRYAPERVVQTINTPNSTHAKAFIMAWLDTHEARAAESTAFAILNDTDHAPTDDVVEALQSYQINPVLWSRRDIALRALAA